jgi:Lrp/AsnC family leucine-responsive transcriptional regulator
MPLLLDRIDVLILRALLEDGRRSYRTLAKMTGVSTPTVESRTRRMFETGFIKRISPIFNTDKMTEKLTALITFRVNDTQLQDIAAKFSDLNEVRSIFLITGESNLMIRVVVNDSRELQDFISGRTAEFGNMKVVSSQIVTKSIKDEQGVIISDDLGISLTCDYCKGDVAGKTFKLKVGQGERYFCCKVCLTSYKEKYKTRIEALSKKTT